MANIILKIYEIQNIGKGIIYEIEPENLLESFSFTQGVQGFQDTLNINNNITGTATIDVSNGATLITQPNDLTLDLGGYSQISNIGLNLTPLVSSVISRFGKKLFNTFSGLNVTNLGMFIEDMFHSKGLEYSGDYETNFTARSLVTKQYADSLTGTTYSAGTGLSLVGTTFNNTAPDQTVVLTQGGATTITGTYPNFTISSADTNTTYSAGTGLQLVGTVFSVENLQKVITYPTDFTGTNYTLTNADNNYEIIVDNGATAVSITVPSGLVSKIGIGFTQKGTGDISYTASGTTINNPIGLKIKGQYYQTYLSQELSTNIFYLGGNTKA